MDGLKVLTCVHMLIREQYLQNGNKPKLKRIMENIIFATNVVLPVFLLVFIGVVLKKTKIINHDFCRTASKVVFNVTLPSLVFLKISSADYSHVFNPQLILFVLAALFAIFIFSWLVAVKVSKDGRDQGAFIQGSFRSNFAIIGFALINNAFGSASLANAAILLGFIMPLYNILAILSLTIPLHNQGRINPLKIAKTIAKNPLIIAVVIALPASYFQMTLPHIFTNTINYLAALTLPLALLAIGGSLSFTGLKKDFRLSITSVCIKIVIMPASLTLFGFLFGFRGIDLGVMFFLFAGPTAVASYAMADAMGSNERLAGNIILLSTLGSIFTISLGLYILKSFSLV